jgi:hypothetical protein
MQSLTAKADFWSDINDAVATYNELKAEVWREKSYTQDGTYFGERNYHLGYYMQLYDDRECMYSNTYHSDGVMLFLVYDSAQIRYELKGFNQYGQIVGDSYNVPVRQFEFDGRNNPATYGVFDYPFTDLSWNVISVYENAVWTRVFITTDIPIFFDWNEAQAYMDSMVQGVPYTGGGIANQGAVVDLDWYILNPRYQYEPLVVGEIGEVLGRHHVYYTLENHQQDDKLEMLAEVKSGQSNFREVYDIWSATGFFPRSADGHAYFENISLINKVTGIEDENDTTWRDNDYYLSAIYLRAYRPSEHRYSGWVKVVVNRAHNVIGIEYGDFDGSDWTADPDKTSDLGIPVHDNWSNGGYDGGLGDGSNSGIPGNMGGGINPAFWATNSLSSMLDSLGEFPAFLGYCFGFIPAPILAMIGLGIVLAIILRIVGR